LKTIYRRVIKERDTILKKKPGSILGRLKSKVISEIIEVYDGI